MPKHGQRIWMKNFTIDELRKYKDTLKTCPRCSLIGYILEDFGLRRRPLWYDKARTRVVCRDQCFSCQARLAAKRLKNNPEKWQESLNKLRALDKRDDTKESRKEYLKLWQKINGDKMSKYAMDYQKKNPKKHFARLIAKAAFPDVKECSIDSCINLGVRHHEDYSKPTEIIWLCSKHHAERHKEIREDNNHVLNRSQQNY